MHRSLESIKIQEINNFKREKNQIRIFLRSIQENYSRFL